MTPVRVAALLALLVCATSVSAGEPEPLTSDPGNRRVCFLEARTGSNIKQRICMTEAERERRRKEDQEAMSKLRSSSAGAGRANVEPNVRR